VKRFIMTATSVQDVEVRGLEDGTVGIFMHEGILLTFPTEKEAEAHIREHTEDYLDTLAECTFQVEEA